MKPFLHYLMAAAALLPWSVSGQEAAPGTATLTLPAAAAPKATVPKEPPPLKPVPTLSAAEIEAFLASAPISSQKILESGTTKSTRATLSDGKLTHDAHIQALDMFRAVFRGKDGTVEKNFRDTYKFNIAAYRLGKMLGIEKMIPASIERDFEGKPASYTWWLDNVWMTEAERRDAGIKPPATQEWSDQLNVIRVFDQLIYNTDRNQGNLVIDPEWKVYMIDHTRAFRTSPTLMKIEALGRMDYGLFQKLQALKQADVTAQLGAYLRTEEIAGLMARRDVIVRHFQKEVKQKGEDSVFTQMPRRTPQVSLP